MPLCYDNLRSTWSLVAGVSPEKQWHPKFVPYTVSVKPDDSDAVVTSVLGGNYLFAQPLNVYALHDFIDFTVKVKLNDGTFAELRRFLDSRGTYKQIALRLPFDMSRHTHWLQTKNPVYTPNDALEYSVSISLRSDPVRTENAITRSIPKSDTTPPTATAVS